MNKQGFMLFVEQQRKPPFDNPSCVNPGHLFAGTARDNSIDMMKKGRQTTAKLNVKQVAEIKEKMKNGARNCQLAREYGVVKGTIANIRSGDNWRHV